MTFENVKQQFKIMTLVEPSKNYTKSKIIGRIQEIGLICHDDTVEISNHDQNDNFDSQNHNFSAGKKMENMNSDDQDEAMTNLDTKSDISV